MQSAPPYSPISLSVHSKLGLWCWKFPGRLSVSTHCFARGSRDEGIYDLQTWSGSVLKVGALVGKVVTSRVGVALACLILSSPQILFAKGPTEPAQLWSTDLSNDPDFAKRGRAENSILLRPPTLD